MVILFGSCFGPSFEIFSFYKTIRKFANYISDYSDCKLAKFSALPFDLVHKNISFFSCTIWFSSFWYAPISKKWGSRYYVSFIDDYTHYCWVFLMKHWFEFLIIYISFWALVKTQHFAVIKCFRCDLSGEYIANAFLWVTKIKWYCSSNFLY